jgi:hypothetical protein
MAICVLLELVLIVISAVSIGFGAPHWIQLTLVWLAVINLGILFLIGLANDHDDPTSAPWC